MSVEGINFSIASTSVAKLPEREQKIRNKQNLHPAYYKDVVEYVKNNIDNIEIQKRILEDLKKVPQGALLNFVKTLQDRANKHEAAYNKEVSGKYAYKIENKNVETKPEENEKAKDISVNDLLSMQDDLYNNDSLNVEGESNESAIPLDTSNDTSPEMQDPS
jgi:hypothetical protein